MRKKGFTLVEVIVAIVLIGLVGVAFIPAIGMGYSRLITSMNITVDAYDVQADLEKILEEKRHLLPDGSTNLTVFGVPISGHLITYPISPAKNVYVFQPKSNIVYTLLEITSDIQLTVVGQTPTPKEIDMFDSMDTLKESLKFQVSESDFTVSSPSEHLVNVYKWYTSPQMHYVDGAPLDSNFNVKEWNAARALNTYEQFRSNGITPNIQNDPSYNELSLGEVKTGYALDNTEMINRFGNRFVYYSVTPYAISGRIGKEKLSNPIYINAPRIEIKSAKFSSSDDKVVEIEFESAINEWVAKEFMSFPESLGNLASAARSSEDPKKLLLTFENALPRSQTVYGAILKKGSVLDATYGNIDIWHENEIEKPFKIDSSDGSIPIEKLVLSQTSITTVLGHKVEVKVTILPENASDKTLTLVNSDDTIVSVLAGTPHENELALEITGLKAGESDLKISSPDGQVETDLKMTVISKPLLLQLDANERVTEASGKVSAWQDISGNMRTFTQMGEGNKPSLIAEATQKKMPGILFEDTLDFMTYTGLPLIGDPLDPESLMNTFSLFILTKTNTPTKDGVYFSFSGEEKDFYAFSNAPEERFRHRINGQDYFSEGDSKIALHSAYWDKEIYIHRQNQVEKARETPPIVLLESENAVLGAENKGAMNHLDGMIFEVRMYKGDLTERERLAVEEEMLDRWLRLKSWTFNHSTEDWVDKFGISYLSSTEEGTLKGTITRRNAYLESKDALNFDVSNHKRLMFRLKNSSSASKALIGFRIGSNTTFFEKEVALNSGADFFEYVVEMPNNWVGNLNQLRFYPAEDVSSSVFELDYIRIIE